MGGGGGEEKKWRKRHSPFVREGVSVWGVEGVDCIVYVGLGVKRGLFQSVRHSPTEHARIAIFTDSQSSIRALGWEDEVEHTPHDMA